MPDDKPHTGGRPPVDEHTRARIRKLGRDGMSRNAIARTTGVSAATVSTICKAAGITFDRAKTAPATKARVADLKAERVRLAERVMAKAHELLDRIDAPHEIVHWDKDGALHRATIDAPTAADVQRYMISVGVATDKHLALIKADSDDRELSAVDLFLAAMMRDAPSWTEPQASA